MTENTGGIWEKFDKIDGDFCMFVFRSFGAGQLLKGRQSCQCRGIRIKKDSAALRQIS